MNRDVEIYKADQQLCEIADILLQTLVEKQLNGWESLKVLQKAIKTVETSIHSVRWGTPLICRLAENETCVWNRELVEREIQSSERPEQRG